MLYEKTVYPQNPFLKSYVHSYWILKSRTDKAEPCLLPPDYEEIFKNTFPDLEYHYINNVSHFYMLEVPYKLNQLIYDFLEKVYK